MKKNLVIGLVLAVSVSFSANAGTWSEAESLYTDLKTWAVNAIKPLKPEW